MSLDFEIRIRPDGRGGNRVDVLRSPAGDGTGELRLPFSAPDLIERRARIRGLAAEVPAAGVRDLQLPAERGVSEERRREQAGAELFDALFDDRLRPLYERSLEIVRRREGERLRLILKVDPGCVDLAHIQAQPWEYLFHRRQGRFPCLYRQSPLIRVLDVDAAPPPPPSDVLRVLVMASRPDDLDHLDLEQELRHLRELSEGHPTIEVEVLPEPSLAALRAALLEREVHVLHYMGHGGFDAETGEGTLALTGADGGLVQAPGRALAHVLYDCRSLRLAVLNACETGRNQDRDGENPFAGVGTALIQGGVPAVIAMQAPITDPSAIAFADCFYRRLAAGDPLDVAVSEGRQRIFTAGQSHEWGTPVLFTSAPDLEVYRPPAVPRADPAPRRRRPLPRVLIPAVAALLLVAVLAAIAAAVPAPAAEVALELEAAAVGFRLARSLDPLANLPLEEIAAGDLARIELPAVPDRPGRALRPEPGRPLGFRLARADGGPPLTLNQSRLPEGTWVYLESVGEGRYRLELVAEAAGDAGVSAARAAGPPAASAATTRLRVNFQGPVDFKSFYEPLERLQPAGPVSAELTPRRDRLVVDLILAGNDLTLEPDAEVTGLEFYRVEDHSALERTDLRAVSTVLAGSVRFASGRVHELTEGEVLRIGECAGVVRRIALGRDRLTVGYRGRVSGLSGRIPGDEAETELMPSLLANLFSNRSL